MYSLPDFSKKLIEGHLDELFENLAYWLLGSIPQGEKAKSIVFSTQPPAVTLANLFVQAMRNNRPNDREADALKGMLRTSYNYIDGLKSQTKAKAIVDLESYISKQKRNGLPVDGKVAAGILTENMEKAKTGLMAIVSGETARVKGMGHAMDILKISHGQGVSDPTCFFVVQKDNRVCPFCLKNHLLEDGFTPKVYKMSEISSGYLSQQDRKDGKVSLSGQHPNCFVNKNHFIMTEHAGSLRIDKVKIGDRVLTHTGKFKAVIGNLESWTKTYSAKVYKIYFEDNGAKRQNNKDKIPSYLSVTPDHQLMTQRGWVAAKELSTEDTFSQLYTKCSTCEKEIPVKYGSKKKGRVPLGGSFCSSKCVADFQWKNPEHRKNISECSTRTAHDRFEKDPHCFDKGILAANTKTRELIASGEFWAQKKENYDILALNMSLNNQRMNKVSKEEIVFLEELRKFYPDLETQQVVQKWCVDGLLENGKIIIEYDGGGHCLPVYTGQMTMDQFLGRQKGRDSYLSKCGYHTLRYQPGYNIQQVIEDIERVRKNSDGEYFFKPTKIKKIVIGKASQQKLYDLTVEDDESFVVDSIISHNCRCSMAFCPSGYGFKQGRFTFIGLNHDEYEKQRGESN